MGGTFLSALLRTPGSRAAPPSAPLRSAGRTPWARMLAPGTWCAPAPWALRRLPGWALLTSAAAHSRACPGAPPLRGPSGPRGPRRPVPRVDFGDPEAAYRSRASWELLRALLVLRLCAVEPLLQRHQQRPEDLAPDLPFQARANVQALYRGLGRWRPRSVLDKHLLEVSRRLLGQRLFDSLMKMTFYGHFVGGEDPEAVRGLIAHNRSFGVGSILDYGVEEDLSQEEAEEKEMDSCTSQAEREGQRDGQEPRFTASLREKQFQPHRAFGDRRVGVTSARTYFYFGEDRCDQHLNTFLQCLEASAETSDDGFSTIKLTALGRPQFLLQFSEVLKLWKKFFLKIAAQQGLAGLPAVETKLEVTALQKTLENMGLATQAEIQDWFTGKILGLSGTVDLLDWNGLINKTQLSKLFRVPDMQTGRLEPLLSHFTEEEDGQMKRMLQRMDILAKRAVELGVRLMVDAEQTYFQPAISCLTLEMQRKFNVEKPMIFNTYQCYLKEAYDAISVDIELAQQEGWCFAAKLVRGAYMKQERARAVEVGYEDPINPTYEATHATYYRCLDHILEEIKHRGRANIMVASHNEFTVRYTMRRMAELGLHPADKKVYFGQLLGMCDQITFPLGQAGYPVYKYVPYGPVRELLPYLSRRALENRGVLKGAQRERELLWKEFKRRLLSGNLFYQPRAGPAHPP